ncbi:MAG: VTT domain-containing protein [Acidobacteriota bacterium]|nr:VTT domain-containing protein [Acidobacteriota bacterium]
MKEALEFVTQHGYLVLFAWVLAEQAGLPIPSVPILVAAGSLASAGKMSLVTVLLVSVVASLFSDSFWFYLGRIRGTRVLNMLCRISLEPDSCVRRTEMAFAGRGAPSLLFAKFVPGFSTAAPPMAGIVGMSLLHFLIYDALGSLLWAGSFVALGYIFGHQIFEFMERALLLGGRLGWLLLALFGLYLLWKWAQRQRFIRQLRIARITPQELKTRLDAGEDITIVDLRGRFEFQGTSISRAIRMAPEDIEHMNHEIPRGREIVLFCT